MRLYLDIIDGPYKGEKLTLNEATSIGRKGAQRVFEDVKLSAIHAFFKYSESEGWSIIDNGSRNGVWINGQREQKSALKDGDLIRLGNIQFRCRLPGMGDYEFSNKVQSWLGSRYKKIKNSKCLLSEVRPEVRLKVIQGLQYGEFWDIFYGPRIAGKNSADICLFDKEAPEETFEIRLKGKYAYFYTENEAVVKINQESVKEKQLVPGDVISFGESKIIIEINEGHGFNN